jgi:hypothetical protein
MEDHMEDQASSHARGAAWAVLAFAGSTMVSFNIWHALHGGIPQLPLAVLAGVVPVALAMGMSHIVAAYSAGRFLKVVTFAVMVGAMVLSVRATGYVVRPAFGPLWWLYGGVVDSAALVALQVILAPAPEAVPGPIPAPAPAAPEKRSPRPAPRRSGNARRSAPADDLTLEARALELLGAHPKMSGAALGRELGVHESYGRKLRNRLARPADTVTTPLA